MTNSEWTCDEFLSGSVVTRRGDCHDHPSARCNLLERKLSYLDFNLSRFMTASIRRVEEINTYPNTGGLNEDRI